MTDEQHSDDESFRIRASWGLFALVVVLKPIGMAIGDTWSFAAMFAQLRWWPHLLGTAVLLSMIPWWPALYDDAYFSAVGLKRKLVVSVIGASILPAMELLNVLMGLEEVNRMSWDTIINWSAPAVLFAWVPFYESHG